MDRIVDFLRSLFFSILDVLGRAIGFVLGQLDPVARTLGVPVEWIAAGAAVVFFFALYRGLATFAEKQR
jgi:hypothetical protein